MSSMVVRSSSKGRLFVESPSSAETRAPAQNLIAEHFTFFGQCAAMSIDLLQSTVASWLLRPRALNLVLAAWLSVSAFLFPHLPAQRVVSLLSGIAGVALALMARRSVMAHRAVVAVAFWIILSFFLFWPLPATAWNNTVIAIAMVCLATMKPDQFSSRRRRLRSSWF